MPLTWDITKIALPEEDIWIKNQDDEEVLNGLTEIMIFATVLVGIREITKKNSKDFYKRMEEFEVASGMRGLLLDRNGTTKEGTEEAERTELHTRMPTLQEIELHIGLKTNAVDYTKKKWHGNLKRILTDTANENIRTEQESITTK